MKKMMPALYAALILLCLYFACCFHSKPKGEVDLSIQNGELAYTYKVSFFSGLTPDVSRYVDSCAHILRKDTARLRIIISEGKLTITADKEANSAGAMIRIRNTCESISNHIIQY